MSEQGAIFTEPGRKALEHFRFALLDYPSRAVGAQTRVGTLVGVAVHSFSAVRGCQTGDTCFLEDIQDYDGNARMDYIRRFDRSQATATGFPEYNASWLASLESMTVLGSWIGPGGCGPGLHYHSVDQFYFLVDGSLRIQLGHEIEIVQQGSLVEIPAGVPHQNWQVGPSEEFHVELFAATPPIGAPLLTFVDTPEDAPGNSRSARVQPVREEAYVTPAGFDGFALQELANCPTARISAARLTPGGAGPGLHVHEFDQAYVVLRGTLNVEVALQQHEVQAGSLVLLPAGVPHRQWNGGEANEEHLAILAPSPAPERPWDVGVVFRAEGDVHYGPGSLER